MNVQASGSGFEQSIVIARRPKGRVAFRFPLRLRGLVARSARGGVVEFVDRARRVVARSGRGRVTGAQIDSKSGELIQTDLLTGSPTKTARVASRLVGGRGGGQALVVVPDQRFLRDKKVRYPVTVEPGAIGLAARARSSRPSRRSRPRSLGAGRPLAFDPCGGGVGGGTGEPCGPPGAPTSVMASALNEKIDVTWAAPFDGGPPSSYTVTARRARDDSVIASQTVGASFAPQAAFTFRDGIANGVAYYVDIVASSELGDGPGSQSATVTPVASPFADTDTLGGSNPSMPAVSCRSSWGVDCDTGNFSYSQTALSVPGRGLPLEFTWTYNSLTFQGESSLGGRWSTNYSMQLKLASGGRYVRQENGSTVYFFDDGHGGWHPEGGAQATLTNNADGGYTFRRTRELTTFVFSNYGRLLSQSDRNGYETKLYYNSSGTVSRVTDPAGRSLTFAYTNPGGGFLGSVTDPAGRRVSFGYDSANQLAAVTDAAGGVTRFGYVPASDGEKHLVSITKPNGNVQTNAYDGNALGATTGTTSSFDPGGSGLSGRTMIYNFSGSTRAASTTTITDANGNTVVARHANHLLGSLTRGSGSPQAATSTFTHDPVTMQITSLTDPRGKVWRNTFDARGNRLSATDPLGRQNTATYNSLNEPLTETDPLGVTTTYTYDPNGNPKSVSRPLGAQTQTTTYRYDPSKAGDLASVIDATGREWSYAYDASGNRVSETSPLGEKATFGFDGVGRLTSSTTPRGNAAGANPADFTTTYGYDDLDDLTSVGDPLGAVTRFGFDANRNLTSRTDANGRRTVYAYDRYDQLTKVTRPDGSTLTTGYDKTGNVASQTDPLGKTTTYGYDALNRLASETDPLGRRRSLGYDPAGNQTSLTDPAGRTSTYGYDDAGQLKQVTYSDGRTPAVSYGYDAAGRRTSMSDGSGQSTYDYDPLGRLTGHSDGVGQRVSYGYDLGDRLTSIVYPAALAGGGTVTRDYDQAGRLQAVTDWLGHRTAFGYDPDSDLTSVAYPNGAQSVRGYDRVGRQTSVTDSSLLAGTFLNLGYGRDPAGRVSSEGSKTFGYDQNDRVASQSESPTASYGYDAGDNPTSATVAGGSAKTLSYDPAHQLTTMTTCCETPPATTGAQTATAAYSYDRDGNRISDGAGATYAYDQADRLTAYNNATYGYDGDGLRTKKTTSSGTRTHTWDLAQGMPLIIGDGNTAYLTGPDGLPLEQITSPGVARYYHQDQLGSTRAITEQTGTVTASYAYDPYGNPTAASDPLGDTGALGNPFGYAGQYTDKESGLQYLRARYYDPQTLNFLTRDPITPTTRTPYTYTNNNPLNNTDPTGLKCNTTDQDGGSGRGKTELLIERPGRSSPDRRAGGSGQGEIEPLALRVGVGALAEDDDKPGGSGWDTAARYTGACAAGAVTGAYLGGIVGAFAGPEGIVPGAATGGALGCVGGVIDKKIGLSDALTK